MIYVTQRQHPQEKEISWRDLITDNIPVNETVTGGSAATVTRKYESPSQELLTKVSTFEMIEVLKEFNYKHKALFEKERQSMYHTFYIPKRNGKLRQIDAPNDDLQEALRELRDILSDRFGVLYHTSGYAYVKKRNTVQCVRKHQQNKSNWFYHTDISGFFPSTTLDFTMRMCELIFPLSEICLDKDGRKELEKALSLGFLNGGLPQGTVLSPYLCNIISIPADYEIFKRLTQRRFVYTRYADDIFVSCVQSFDPNVITSIIKEIYDEFKAPWTLKPEKTHYGSRKGRNTILGLKLNADNNITVGYKTKEKFRAMLSNFIQDQIHGKEWTKDEARSLSGLISYYKMVEPEYFQGLIKRYNSKYHTSTNILLKQSING